MIHEVITLIAHANLEIQVLVWCRFSGRKRHQLNFKVYYVTLRETSETTLAYSSLSERETENPDFSRLNRPTNRARFWAADHLSVDVSRKTQRFCSTKCQKLVQKQVRSLESAQELQCSV